MHISYAYNTVLIQQTPKTGHDLSHYIKLSNC